MNNNFKFYKFDRGRVFIIDAVNNRAFIIDENGSLVESPFILTRILDVDCDYYEITREEFDEIINKTNFTGRRL